MDGDARTVEEVDLVSPAPYKRKLHVNSKQAWASDALPGKGPALHRHHELKEEQFDRGPGSLVWTDDIQVAADVIASYRIDGEEHVREATGILFRFRWLRPKR